MKEREGELKRARDRAIKKKAEDDAQRERNEQARLEGIRQRKEADRLDALRKAEEEAKKRHDAREALRLEKLRRE